MTKQILQRGTILAAALLLWFLSQAWLGGRPPVQGIGDRVHGLTNVPHSFLDSRPQLTNTILIVSSLGIDLIGLGLLGWGLYGRHHRRHHGPRRVDDFKPLVAKMVSVEVDRPCRGSLNGERGSSRWGSPSF